LPIHQISHKDLDSYVRPLQKINIENAYGPPGKTEAWQPLDAGHLGAAIKTLAKEFLEIWMYKDFTGAKKDTFEHVAKNW
jgi:hypothetical protein